MANWFFFLTEITVGALQVSYYVDTFMWVKACGLFLFGTIGVLYLCEIGKVKNI